MLFKTRTLLHSAATKGVRPLVVLFWLSLTACATFSSDPRARTPGTIIDDQVIESLVKREIKKSDPGFDSAHLVAVSYNGVLLLAGQVASEDLKTHAYQVAEGIDKIRKIHNEIEVGGPISYVARTNDSWLTGKVKTKLLADKRVNANRVKVVTENGVVYLLGLLPRQQADDTVTIARSVYGVQKIVKVFEYLD
ncbi:MAG: BON domain-containing protein [Gammaproteobacteria bacterium]|nr:BON domain-containing protein [Gammaproteobacteria bacterium]